VGRRWSVSPPAEQEQHDEEGSRRRRDPQSKIRQGFKVGADLGQLGYELYRVLNDEEPPPDGERLLVLLLFRALRWLVA
jgi:hypothetical protein